MHVMLFHCRSPYIMLCVLLDLWYLFFCLGKDVHFSIFLFYSFCWHSFRQQCMHVNQQMNECTFHYQMFIVISGHEFKSNIDTVSSQAFAIPCIEIFTLNCICVRVQCEVLVCALNLSFDLKSTLQISVKLKWYTFSFLYKMETYFLFIACITVIDHVELNLFSILFNSIFLSVSLSLLLTINYYHYDFICINIKIIIKFLQIQKSIRLGNDMKNYTIEIVCVCGKIWWNRKNINKKFPRKSHLNYKIVLKIFLLVEVDRIRTGHSNIHLRRMERLVLSTVDGLSHFFNKSRSRFAKYLLVVLRRNRRTYVAKCVVASCAGETLIFSNTSIVFNTVAISVTWNDVWRTTKQSMHLLIYLKLFQ